jgi:hypothetical protein
MTDEPGLGALRARIRVHSRGSSCPESVINLQFGPLRASVARIWPAGLRVLAAGLVLR